MSEDLSTRLRAALDEREGHYRESVGDEAYQEMMATSGDLNEGYIIGEALRALAIIQAHREILHLALTCRADYALAAERVAASRGQRMSIAKAQEAAEAAEHLRDALTRLQLAESILSIVARGYGLEEE